MSHHSEIVQLISRYLPLSDEEAAIVEDCIPVKEYTKGTILLREGQVSSECYFTITGCVRHYYLIDGLEKTTCFYTEEESIASMNSYINRVPANHFLSCVEDCKLAVLGYEKEKELYKKLPHFESLCRVSMESEFGKQQEMLATHIISSPEERFTHLLDTKPELIQRVPQYHLASYLGVKPESLSRIKKRIADRRP